jgi:hypothetical protein
MKITITGVWLKSSIKFENPCITVFLERITQLTWDGKIQLFCCWQPHMCWSFPPMYFSHIYEFNSVKTGRSSGKGARASAFHYSLSCQKHVLSLKKNITLFSTPRIWILSIVPIVLWISLNAVHFVHLNRTIKNERIGSIDPLYLSHLQMSVQFQIFERWPNLHPLFLLMP